MCCVDRCEAEATPAVGAEHNTDAVERKKRRAVGSNMMLAIMFCTMPNGVVHKCDNSQIFQIASVVSEKWRLQAKLLQSFSVCLKLASQTVQVGRITSNRFCICTVCKQVCIYLCVYRSCLLTMILGTRDKTLACVEKV